MSLYLYLEAVRVPLSWIGIFVCLYKFKKLVEWAPAVKVAQVCTFIRVERPFWCMPCDDSPLTNKEERISWHS